MIRLFLTLFVLIVAFIYGLPAYFDGDLFLWPVMSIIKPTLFIWEQNRYLNIVGIIFGFIKNPILNLVFEMLSFATLYTFGLYMTITSLCRLIGYKSNAKNSAYIFVVFSTLFLAQKFIFFNAWYGGPYAFSFGLALWLLVDESNFQSLKKIILLLSAMIISGQNPSIVIPISLLMPLIIKRCPGQFRSKIIVYAIIIISAIFWLFIGNLVAVGPSYGFSMQQLIKNYINIILSLSGELNLIILMLVFCATVYVILTKNLKRDVLASSAYIIICGLLCAAIVTANEHVFKNDFNPRYYYYTFVLILLPLVFAVTIESEIVKKSILCIAILISVFQYSHVDIKDQYVYIYKTAKDLMAKVNTGDELLVVGDYWDVIPAVFFGRSFGLDLTPVTYRSLAISDIIGEKLSQGVKVRCISDSDSCNKMAMYAGNFAPVDMNCNQNCFMHETITTKSDYVYKNKSPGFLKRVSDNREYKSNDGFVSNNVDSISGISTPDTYGVWSDANSGFSCVEIKLNKSMKHRMVNVNIILEPYKDNNLLVKTDMKQQYFKLSKGLKNYNFVGPVGSETLISLCPTKPMRPIDSNENADARLLGFFINGINFN